MVTTVVAVGVAGITLSVVLFFVWRAAIKANPQATFDPVAEGIRLEARHVQQPRRFDASSAVYRERELDRELTTSETLSIPNGRHFAK